jgi:hypothetical protein
MEMYRDEQTSYRSLGGYTEFAYALRTPDGISESVNGVAITPQTFRELAVQPLLGRALDDDDALLGVEPVVVLGESLWRRSFGADPGVLGSTVNISGAAVRVVGIQGVGSKAPGGRAELWFPLVMDPRDDDYFKATNVKVVGVLAAGITINDAWNEIDGFNDYIARLFPNFFEPDWDDGLLRVARADASQRRLISTPLVLLLGGTALLLLVTAMNVGNLLLGRAIERRRELAVRAAIGAGRWRIVRAARCSHARCWPSPWWWLSAPGPSWPVYPSRIFCVLSVWDSPSRRTPVFACSEPWSPSRRPSLRCSWSPRRFWWRPSETCGAFPSASMKPTS